MLFNSYTYILIFLPLCLCGYFLLNRMRWGRAARFFLVVASLVYYGWWNPVYLYLIFLSIGVNYGIGSLLAARTRPGTRLSRGLLGAGITFNLGLLGYYKYADFAIANLNRLLGTNWDALGLILPLAISFFTFQQIAFLVDSAAHRCRERDFLSYCLFVCFFPQLIAGPIVHHGEMMPQFTGEQGRSPDWQNIYRGIGLFALGLAKKVLIADRFAEWASAGFAAEGAFIDSWIATLSYTFQIYFDFSGYTDMAIGSALLLNIHLPLNFNSPYKARSIQDFWRRWHITLSRWLRDYLYIPLGGGRCGVARHCVNLAVVFILGGIWHGAGWTFIVWGLLHAAAMIIQLLWTRSGRRLAALPAHAATFLFISVTWVFFRATSLPAAFGMVRAMVGARGWLTASRFPMEPTIWIAACIPVVLFFPNSMELSQKLKPCWRHSLILAALLLTALLSLNRISEFLYYQF